MHVLDYKLRYFIRERAVAWKGLCFSPPFAKVARIRMCFNFNAILKFAYKLKCLIQTIKVSRWHPLDENLEIFIRERVAAWKSCFFDHQPQRPQKLQLVAISMWLSSFESSYIFYRLLKFPVPAYSGSKVRNFYSRSCSCVKGFVLVQHLDKF